MAEPLAGVRLKVERAKAHLAELEESIGAALKPDAEHFLGEFDTESKHHIYRAQNLPVLDPEWALQAGEVTYQLRSALDHLAWQLVEREGTTPNGQTQFPIRDSLLGKKQQLLPLKTLLPLANDCKVLQVLNECQPYYGDGTRELSPPDAHRHPLWILKTLNNIDKHRLLLVVVQTLNIEAMFWGSPTGTKPPIPYLSAVALKEGTPVAAFDFGGAEAPTDFDPHLSLKVVIREEAAALISHAPLGPALDSLIRYVEWDVLENLRMHFFS